MSTKESHKPPVPPKVVRSQVVHVAGQAVVRHEGGLLQTEGRPALPVLEAFQEFLDTERQKARKRLLLVSSLFLLLFILFAGGIVTVGVVYYQQVHTDVAQVRHGLALNQQQSRQAQESVMKSLEEISVDADTLRQQLEGQTHLFLSGQTGLEERLLKTCNDLQNMQDLITKLQETNSGIRWKLAMTAKALDHLTNRVTTVKATRLPDIHQPPAPPAQHPRRASKVLSVKLHSQGSSTSVPWRLPLP